MSFFDSQTDSQILTDLGAKHPEHGDSENQNLLSRDTTALILPMENRNQPEQTNQVANSCFLDEQDRHESQGNGTNSSNHKRSSLDASSIGEDCLSNDSQQTTNSITNRKTSASNTERDNSISKEPRKKRKVERSRSDRGQSRAIKRKDGRYQLTVELSKNLDGSRNRKTFYGKTSKDVHSKVAKFQAQKQLGIIDLDDTMKVSVFAEHWLTNTVPLTCTNKTSSGYRDLLRLHVLPTIGHMRLLDVKPLHIEKVMTSVADLGRTVNTVKAVRRVICALFAAADRNALIPNNPVTKTRTPKARSGETNRKPIPYTEKELKELIKVLEKEPRGLLFLWSAVTGMRRGEVLGVRWSDITITDEGPEVKIERQIKEDRVFSPDGKYTVIRSISKPKTANSIRTVYLPDFLISKLDIYRNELRRSNTARGWSDEDFIFCNTDGSPFWPSNITYEWKELLRRNGLRHIQLHGLRHTFAVLALANNAPLESVSEALGHYSIAITKDMYATRVPGLARKATSAVASVFPVDIDNQQGLKHINVRQP